MKNSDANPLSPRKCLKSFTFEVSPDLHQTRGKLIVIDGIDGAGKATQTELLIKHLKREGFKVEKFDFPQYESFFGELIARYLRGEFGDTTRIVPELISIVYAADRWTSKDRLIAALNQNKIVIANRYVPSNINYQSAKVSVKKRAVLREWIKKLDYKIFGLPKEDLVIYLNLSVATSQKLIRAKKDRTYLNGKKRDRHEQDVKYLTEVAKEYVQYCRREPKAKLIECEQNGQLLTKSEISERIWNIIKSKIKSQKTKVRRQ